MSKKSLNNFNKFYEENKEKLFMEDGETYPINYKMAKLWADSQCDPESRSFANSIIYNTKYVSFKEFYNSLILICESYIGNINKLEYKDNIFILILPFKISKSNIWVSLLAYKYLKGIISDIYYDITNVYNDMKNPTSNLYGKKIRCVICDDCAYTGSQLSYICTMDYANVKQYNSPVQPGEFSKDWLDWYNSIQENIKKEISNLSIKNFSVDIIVPYMSTLSVAEIKKIHYVKIPKNCYVFPIFTEMVELDDIPTNIIKEFEQTFQYHKDISAIYFDHKIADAVSTFNKVYLLAPLFNCASVTNSIGFIKNCYDSKIPKDINIYRHYLDIEKKTKGVVCLTSFYKNITYTFNNKTIKHDAYITDIIY